MADIEKIAGDPECRGNQARLVDFADGVLEEPGKTALQRHLRSCSDCAAALLALREVPGVLREASETSHDEAYWKRQRDDIMARIRTEPVGRRGRKPIWFWGAGLAAAAALVLTVVGYQALRERELLTEQAHGSLAQLDEESISELTDLLEIYVPESRFIPVDIASKRDGAAGVSANTEEDGTPGELGEFSEDELEGLHYLLGKLG